MQAWKTTLDYKQTTAHMKGYFGDVWIWRNTHLICRNHVMKACNWQGQFRDLWLCGWNSTASHLLIAWRITYASPNINKVRPSQVRLEYQHRHRVHVSATSPLSLRAAHQYSIWACLARKSFRNCKTNTKSIVHNENGSQGQIHNTFSVVLSNRQDLFITRGEYFRLFCHFQAELAWVSSVAIWV